jgi:putative intracellular protease/amidase
MHKCSEPRVLLTVRWQHGSGSMNLHHGGNDIRDTAYFQVFGGLADWQCARTFCEIHLPGNWQMQAADSSMTPVHPMGGLRVQPDLVRDQLDPAGAALLIVPGGDLWQRGDGKSALMGVGRTHAAGAPAAAIDSDALARAGLLDQACHTDNWPGQMVAQVPAYRGAEQYDSGVLAVSDGSVTTASPHGSIEFAREVIHTLDI